MSISQSRNNKLAARAREMEAKIAEDMAKGLTGVGYRENRIKYGVGSAVVKKARELAGVACSDKAIEAAKAREAKKHRVYKSKGSDSVLDQMLPRPGGVNWLARAWV